MLLTIFILLVLILPIIKCESNLLQVSCLARHGNRSTASLPMKFSSDKDDYFVLCSDSMIAEKFRKRREFLPLRMCKTGELTEKGKQRMFEYGQKFREKYWHVFGKYDPTIYKFESTDFSRTIDSLKFFLQGYFKTMNIGAIKFEIGQFSNSSKMTPFQQLPQLSSIWEKGSKSSEWVDFLQTINKTQEWIIKKYHPKNNFPILTMYDNLKVRLENGYGTPENFDVEFFKYTERNLMRSWEISLTEEFCEIGSQLYLREVKDMFSVDEKKMEFASTHDFAIVMFYKALTGNHYHNDELPEYGEPICLELYDDDTVRFSYNDETVKMVCAKEKEDGVENEGDVRCNKDDFFVMIDGMVERAESYEFSGSEKGTNFFEGLDDEVEL